MSERLEFRRCPTPQESLIQERRENGRLRAALIAAGEPRPEMVVKAVVREVYGEPRLYPENETAKLFAEVAKTKTLTDATLALIKRLGYRVEIKAATASEQSA